MKQKFFLFFVGILLLAGCSSEQPKNTNAQANQNAANKANVNPNLVGDKLIFSGTGESVVTQCDGREVEITADATSGSYTFKGECKKITVEGVSIDVTAEKVGEIVVDGTSVNVTYNEGLDGKKPKISKKGASTFVQSKKEYDEKQAKEAKNAEKKGN